MKHIQGSFLTGYITIEVRGNRPELFFQQCMEQGIAVWNVLKISKVVCKGNVRLQNMQLILELIEQTNYELNIVNNRGLPFLLKRFMKKREILMAICLSVLLIVFLSNILWTVHITGVSTDVEEKVNKQLKSYGIHPGSWLFSIESPSTIQQKLIKDVPELLWVGVHKKGTSFFLEGVEKTIVKKEEVPGPRHLVATKKGIIQKMFVAKGMPKVKVNDYVIPGKVLVSGIVGSEINQAEEESKENNTLVAAEGEITAKTWYEVKVTIPLQEEYETLTGNQKNKYYLQVNNVMVPIWGFKKPEYKAIHRESIRNPVRFFKWETPLSIVETTLSEKILNNRKRTKQDAINLGILQAKHELQLQLGPKAKVLSENVLHESVQNGKVNLHLYITVEEDIAKSEPIT